MTRNPTENTFLYLLKTLDIFLNASESVDSLNWCGSKLSILKASLIIYALSLLLSQLMFCLFVCLFMWILYVPVNIFQTSRDDLLSFWVQPVLLSRG